MAPAGDRYISLCLTRCQWHLTACSVCLWPAWAQTACCLETTQQFLLFLSCVGPPLRLSLHNRDFVYFTALLVSVLGVFIRGWEEREMRLPVWRQVKVNKLSLVGGTWAIIQAVYCTHLPRAGSGMSYQLNCLFLFSKCPLNVQKSNCPGSVIFQI